MCAVCVNAPLGAAVAASLTLASTLAANAGGYTPPVVDSGVVAPIVETAPVGDWAGGYAGLTLGYAFGGDDEVGLDVYNGGDLFGRGNNLGSTDMKGVNGGLHIGYRWQRDNWVFGPELWVEGGSIDATDTISYSGTADGTTITVEGEMESKVNYLAGLQFKTGYVVNPQTLVYGTIGYVHGDFDLSFGETVNYTANGYSVGLGAERKLRDNLSVLAEWQYRNFGKTDVAFGSTDDGEVTRATPEHHNFKLGLNFKF